MNLTDKKTVYGAVLTLLCLAPLALYAQEEDSFSLEEAGATSAETEGNWRDFTRVESSVEVGAGYVNQDSFKFGEYTGLHEQGGFFIGNLDVRVRDAYDSEDAHYLTLRADNLGLDTRALQFAYGEQGSYKFTLDYDQIPSFHSNSTRTIFMGVGGENLTLPAGWVASATTAGMTALTTSLNSFDVQQERHRTGLGYSRVLGSNWDIKTHYRHETKEGLRVTGAVIGNSGGNPRSVLIPQPIDYVTDQFEINLGYHTNTLQAKIGYYLSLFSDENTGLTWQNPYAAHANWSPSAGYVLGGGGQGRIASPPDSQFHQLTTALGYSLTATTRLTADAAFGMMRQNDAFLPYSVNPALTVTQALPRESLDGRLDTSLLNVRLSSRPIDKVDLNAAYRYEDRDNKTPKNEYVYIGGDSQDQDTTAASPRRRYNHPYSYKNNQVKVGAGYTLLPRTRVNLGYTFERIERTYSEREESDEATYDAGLKSAFSETFSGGLTASRARRNGSTYVGEEPFLTGYSSGYTSTVPGGWENHPDMRKFFLADRVRDKLALFTSFTPDEAWSIGFNTYYTQDDYYASEMGLTGGHSSNFILDSSYVPGEGITTYSFYSYERSASEQDGRAFSGGGVKLTQAADPTRDWFASHNDRVHTFGLGIKKQVHKRLELGSDYTYAKSYGDIDVLTGSSLTSAPLPTLKTRLNQLRLYSDYQLADKQTVKLSYWLERYESTDWALDGVDPNTLPNVVTLGEDTPSYRVRVVTLSFLYKF